MNTYEKVYIFYFTIKFYYRSGKFLKSGSKKFIAVIF